jgi:hypothetical protein
VPEDFTVPFDPTGADGQRWPERMQGLRLGKYFKKLVTEAVSLKSCVLASWCLGRLDWVWGWGFGVGFYQM